MITHFMPDKKDFETDLMLRWIRSDLLRRTTHITWRGNSFAMPRGTVLIEAGTYHLTTRTPEGCLVTYKPRKAPR